MSRISEDFNLHLRTEHVVVTVTDGVFVIGGPNNPTGKVGFFLFFNQDGDENENMKKYKDLAQKKKLFDLQFRNIFTMNIL